MTHATSVAVTSDEQGRATWQGASRIYVTSLTLSMQEDTCGLGVLRTAPRRCQTTKSGFWVSTRMRVSTDSGIYGKIQRAGVRVFLHFSFHTGSVQMCTRTFRAWRSVGT